jgi:maltose O-acetyltransferase
MTSESIAPRAAGPDVHRLVDRRRPRRTRASVADRRPPRWMPLLNAVGASQLLPSRARVVLYRLAGADVNLRSDLRPGIFLRSPRLRVGRHSTINHRCLFDNRAMVSLGDRVGVGVDVKFITSTHSMDDPATRAGAGRVQPISVGDGAWIGSSVTVLAGVTIGAGAVIAAGAVVTRDCAPNVLYGGVPARRIRDLPSQDLRAEMSPESAHEPA